MKEIIQHLKKQSLLFFLLLSLMLFGCGAKILITSSPPGGKIQFSKSKNGPWLDKYSARPVGKLTPAEESYGPLTALPIGYLRVIKEGYEPSEPQYYTPRHDSYGSLFSKDSLHFVLQLKPETPPPHVQYEDTMYLMITSEPPGADVLTVKSTSKSWETGEKIGTTPFSVPVKFVEWKGYVWFKDSVFVGEKPWSPSVEGTAHRIRFFLQKVGCYGVFANTHLYFAGRSGHHLKTVEGHDNIDDGDRVTVFGCPVKLIQQGRSFAKKFADVIEKKDFYEAEQLRLRRIQILRERIEENSRFWDTWLSGDGTQNSSVDSKLISSELEWLEHTVGLLDPLLMSFRRQLVQKLNEGEVEAALALAQAVAALEKKYFPEPQPESIKITESHSMEEASKPQLQSQGPQQIVVQEKPYYGVTNVVQALGAIRGSKLDPEAYQRALGGAQLLDIMGFGSFINK